MAFRSLLILKISFITVAMLVAATFSKTSNALMLYSQDFETMTPGQGWPPNDLSNDGWEIFGTAFDANPYTGPANRLYDYGPFDAANGSPGSIQEVVPNPGGAAQGNLVLNKYSDYNNTDQSRYYITASTFQEQTITSADVGFWRLSYDARIANLEADSSAYAYIRTQDSTGLTARVTKDTTNLPALWDTYTLDLMVEDSMVGDILQFGFTATATKYNGSGVYYDNINFAPVPLPAAAWLFASGLLGLVGVARRKSS